MSQFAEKINLKNFSRKELTDFIENSGEKSFRADQLWQWIYQKQVTAFSEMTNIAKSFQEKLTQIAKIETLTLKEKIESESGTVKFLWQLNDGLAIESVYIPEGKRKTLCVSSQVGCTLGCRFCATGKLGFIRNLEPFEITDQVLSVQRELQLSLSNIVIMGMGEPFLNYTHLLKALYILNDQDGVALGHRKITISTAGIIPKLRQYTSEKHPFKLAISLNATTQVQRENIMPITRTYALNDLMMAAREYTKHSKKRITFEYVLLKNVNDSYEDISRLKILLKNIPCKLNIIAYNDTASGFITPSESHIKWFSENLKSIKAPVTVRLSKGDDIQGACGQLAAQNC